MANAALFSQLEAVNPLFDRGSYEDGYAVFCAKLESQNRSGNVEVEIEFDIEHDDPLIILVLCMMERKFTVDTRGKFICTEDARHI